MLGARLHIDREWLLVQCGVSAPLVGLVLRVLGCVCRTNDEAEREEE